LQCQTITFKANKMKTLNKEVARKILKNVKGGQFTDNLQDFHAFFTTYRNLGQVTRSTDKAFFIAEPTHPGCKEGFWLPKSVCKFSFEESRSGEVEVTMSFNRSYTLQGQEEKKHSGFSAANAIANFITRTGGDVYCNA